MTNAQFEQWKPTHDYVDRIWDAAWADWRKERDEKARAIAAMVAAGQPRQATAEEKS